MRTYELQVQKSGKWTIDAVFDDREFALLEAKRVEGNKRHSVLRVVEELYDEEQGRTVTRTIFSGGRTIDAPSRRTSVDSGAGHASSHAAAPTFARKTSEAPKKKQPSYFGILIKLLAIIAAGGAALYGIWRHFDAV